MPERVSDRFFVIRHPESQGAIVAKFDAAGGRLIPDEVAEFDDFVIQSVSSRSGLRDHEIDQSGLSDEELDLLDQVYPAGRS